MLGTVDLSYVYQLLEAIAASEPAALLEIVARMAEHAPDFEGSLDELIALLHRVAVAQLVPDAIDNSWGDAERVAAIAGSFTGDDTQLFYQTALNGKRDLPLAGDPRSGFEMVLLRMIAFRPAAVIDPAIAPGDLQPVPTAIPSSNAGEVGAASAKKPLTPALESPPDDAPAVKPQPSAAPATSGLARLEPARWADTLEDLGLVGIVYNIASHCELRRCEGDTVEFVLDPEHVALFNAGHPEKIRLALQNYFACELTVTIAPGELQRETPAQRTVRRAQERQQEAVAAIEHDPLLHQLLERFDGELDRGSITPLDN